ncbi:hypothetical protein BTZ20_2563 [Rhodococcus sp. MTM3W5.2]|uniref:hypothetical protein n=1 Tax=Rhodococcus sp. MTM3W5.2 TaxID=1805827 RepID=UPI00097969B7|nr:hypothetical protein [Rhodococcus sp. MTM3W5.2]AQA24638.1 hypothetical protein BTZ20_2563 [Rhodococcus sp. MTM3W5.2]
MIPYLVLSSVLIALVGVVVIGRRTNGGQAFNLDQFRSQAPLAGVLPADHRPRREYHDLVAAYINADVFRAA